MDKLWEQNLADILGLEKICTPKKKLFFLFAAGK